MLYMFKVYTLVALSVFGLAGAVMLAFVAWEQAKQYARALQVMRRVAAGAPSARLVISRVASRNHESAPLRAA